MALFFAGWLRNLAFPFDTHTGLCYTICKLKSVHVYIESARSPDDNADAKRASVLSFLFAEALINSATHLHASAPSSRRRQILDVAQLRLRFVSLLSRPRVKSEGRRRLGNGSYAKTSQECKCEARRMIGWRWPLQIQRICANLGDFILSVIP